MQFSRAGGDPEYDRTGPIKLRRFSLGCKWPVPFTRTIVEEHHRAIELGILACVKSISREDRDTICQR